MGKGWPRVKGIYDFMVTAKYELLVSKSREFAPLSVHNSSNIAMLGVYISMIRTLEDNLAKVLKAIYLLISEDMAKDMPMLALTLELLQSLPPLAHFQ